MKHLVTVLSSLALVLVVSPLFAQEGAQPVVNDTLGVTITPPDGWETIKVAGNEKSVANFRHPDSQSQVEVIGTKLINADVAKVFFDTFHQSLIGADFKEAEAAAPQTIGGHQGTQTEYSFEHTGIKLRVVVFGFTVEDAAFLVIGYFKDDERDTFYKDLQATIERLKFS